jgi:hypothetical protein
MRNGPRGTPSPQATAATWDRASYSAHPIDSIEPLSDEPNGYRAAAIHYLGVIFAVDQCLETTPDAGVAVVAVAVVVGWRAPAD